jgi:hypothetical protein
MSLLARIEAARKTLRGHALSDEPFEPPLDDAFFDALGTAAKELAAEGLVKTLPSIRVAQPSSSGPRVPFRWPRPSRGVVELEQDRNGKVALVEFGIELDTQGTLRHSDFRVVRVMDAFIKEDPKAMLLAARAHAVGQKIPEVRIDVAGHVEPVDADETRRALAGIVEVTNPNLATFSPLLAKFWYAWCQSWLDLPVSGPGSSGIVRVAYDLMSGETLENDAEFSCERHPDLAGLWTLTLESKLHNPSLELVVPALELLVDDPEVPLGDLLEQQTEFLTHLTLVVEPNTFRPLVASRLVGAVVGDPDRPQGQEYEHQLWTFDWQS